MGWICPSCGSENPYAVTRCPVCEHSAPPGKKAFAASRRLEKMDKALYGFPKWCVQRLHSNRYLSLLLVLLLVIAGAGIVRHRNALGKSGQDVPGFSEIRSRIGEHLAASGKAAADVLERSSERTAAQLNEAGERISGKAGTLLGASALAVPKERATELSRQALHPEEGAAAVQEAAKRFADRIPSLGKRVHGLQSLGKGNLQLLERRFRVLRWTWMSNESRLQTGFAEKIPQLHGGLVGILQGFQIGNFLNFLKSILPWGLGKP